MLLFPADVLAHYVDNLNMLKAEADKYHPTPPSLQCDIDHSRKMITEAVVAIVTQHNNEIGSD